MLESFVLWLESLSKIIPLPLFVVLGSFLEEIVAPIPSPLVMTSAGTIIQANGQNLVYVLYIAVIAAVTKTLASLILYFFSDKAEDFFVNKFGSALKISRKEIENIGKHFNNTRRDGLLLFVLRAVPLFPGAPVSILCGIIKLNLKTYISASFLGTVVKNLIYIYAGVLSLNYLESFRDSYGVIENIGYILLIGLVLYFVAKHQGSRDVLRKIAYKFQSLFRQ